MYMKKNTRDRAVKILVFVIVLAMLLSLLPTFAFRG